MAATTGELRQLAQPIAVPRSRHALLARVATGQRLADPSAQRLAARDQKPGLATVVFLLLFHADELASASHSQSVGHGKLFGYHAQSPLPSCMAMYMMRP